MKRVLIIGFLYPFTYSGGSFRTLPLGKYLPEFGWEPVILTPFLFEDAVLPFRVIETKYRDALDFWKKLFGFNTDKAVNLQIQERFDTDSRNQIMNMILACGGAILNYPDPYRGWQPFALEAGYEFLKREKVDAIISCHPVATSHIIASKLKKQYGFPWVADFADLWSQNHNYHYGPISKMIDTRVERKTLSNADVIIGVSPPWADALKTLHKGKTVYAIPHGYDPEEMDFPSPPLTQKFTITFTGSLYPGMQDTALFLRVLHDLVSEKTMDPADIEVRFYTREAGWFRKEIDEYGLSDIVKHYGMVPRKVALEKQRESQLLLVINWEGKERAGYQLKLFEYLAAQRPIIATGGLGNYLTCELLDDTRAGVHAPTTEDVRNSLRELYQEYKLKGKIEYKGDVATIDRYSYREAARKFSEILNQLV